MASTGETLTYLEGRIAAVEWAFAILMKSMPIVGGTSLMEEGLKELSKRVSQDSEPGFQRGFEEGIGRVLDSARRLQVKSPIHN